MSPLLETQGLGYQYIPGAWALRDINLRIHAGDRLAVLGANGAGKSTLLLALAGMLHLTEGQLICEGRPVRSRQSRSYLRDKIGLLLQNPEDQLFAPTVEQDVAFGLLQRGVPNHTALDRSRAVLDRLRISHLAGRQVHQLSLGEKKRVALAGLAAVGPSLLLLDEPSAGLDHDGRCALLEVLRSLQAGGAAVVLTTHDADLAAQWASTVAILDAGRVTAQGGNQRILSDHGLLDSARLVPPSTYVAAMALRELYPPSAEWKLPATLSELDQFVRRIAQSRPSHTPQPRDERVPNAPGPLLSGEL